MSVIFSAELKLVAPANDYDDWYRCYNTSMWVDKKHGQLRICDDFIKEMFWVKEDCSEIDIELHDEKVKDGLPVAIGNWYRDEEVLCGEAFECDYTVEPEVAQLLVQLMHKKRNLHHVWLKVLA